MRIETPQTGRRAVGLTPLIDVVFLLLLFFMLASSFSRYAGIEIGLGGNAAPGQEPAPMLLLTVAPGGEIRIDGSPTPLDEVADTLRLAAGGEARRILVRPRAEASAQDIVSALEVASGAGVGDVVLLR